MQPTPGGMRQPAPLWASAMTAGCHLLRTFRPHLIAAQKNSRPYGTPGNLAKSRKIVVETLDLTDITPVAPQEEFVSTRGPVKPARCIETGDHLMTIGVNAQTERRDSASRVDSVTTMHPGSRSGMHPSRTRRPVFAINPMAVGRYHV